MKNKSPCLGMLTNMLHNHLGIMPVAEVLHDYEKHFKDSYGYLAVPDGRKCVEVALNAGMYAGILETPVKMLPLNEDVPKHEGRLPVLQHRMELHTFDGERWVYLERYAYLFAGRGWKWQGQWQITPAVIEIEARQSSLATLTDERIG